MNFVPNGYPEISSKYLEPTYFFDFENSLVQKFVLEVTRNIYNPVEQTKRLFLAVRDQIRYDPYNISLDSSTYQASYCLNTKHGFCLPKANLLIAAVRAIGIPAGIGLSDVKNHLCTEKMRRMMGGKDIFLHHGYAVIFLENKWLKLSPAFNIELCDRFDVLPTDFDGENHALFQQYDAKGHLHMEYVKDHGIWSDFPHQRVTADFKKSYPPSVYDSKARAAVDTMMGEYLPPTQGG